MQATAKWATRLAVALVVLASQPRGHMQSEAAQVEHVVLTPLARPAALADVHHLPVVPLAPSPTWLGVAASEGAPSCPAALRAIILSGLKAGVSRGFR